MKLIWGFPVTHDKEASIAPKRGLSLLITLMAIATMMTFASDMVVTSTVNMHLAVSQRDQIRANYIAKSGLNLAEFLLTIDWGINLFRGQKSTPSAIKEKLIDSYQSLWTKFNYLPPLGQQAVTILRDNQKKSDGIVDPNKDPFHLSGLMNENVAKIMELFQDQFTIKISDESSKININDCSTGRCTEVIHQLISLFSCPVEKDFLENKKLTPQELAYRLKDFISSSTNTSLESGFSNKNTPYEKYNPPYKIKGLPFDTVDQLKLVAGWDDDVHAVFSPYITVYPFNNVTKKRQHSLINLNTSSRSMLGCLIPSATEGDCNKNFTLEMRKFVADRKIIVNDKEEIAATIKKLMCYIDVKTNNNNMNPISWFSVFSKVLKVQVIATTGEQTKILKAVFLRDMPTGSGGLQSLMQQPNENSSTNSKEQDKSHSDIKRYIQLLYWKLG